MAALPYVSFETADAAVSVFCGEYFTCALFVNGKTRCWGKNDRGQLGVGDASTRGDQPSETNGLTFLTFNQALLDGDSSLSALSSNYVMNEPFDPLKFSYGSFVPSYTTNLWLYATTKSRVSGISLNGGNSVLRTLSTYVNLAATSVTVFVLTVTAQNTVTSRYYMTFRKLPPTTTVVASNDFTCAIIKGKVRTRWNNVM